MNSGRFWAAGVFEFKAPGLFNGVWPDWSLHSGDQGIRSPILMQFLSKRDIKMAGNGVNAAFNSLLRL